MPCSGTLQSKPGFLQLLLCFLQISKIFFTSAAEVIMGYIMDRFPQIEARRRARSWGFKISGCFRQIRIARYPRAGFSSFPRLK